MSEFKLVLTNDSTGDFDYEYYYRLEEDNILQLNLTIEQVKRLYKVLEKEVQNIRTKEHKRILEAIQYHEQQLEIAKKKLEDYNKQ